MKKIKFFAIVLSIAIIAIHASVAYCRTKVMPQSSAAVSTGIGSKLIVNLNGNPTTGYQWTLRTEPKDTNVILIASEGYEATNPNIVGSDGVFKFIIRTIAKGNAKVIAEYKRPFEEAPIQTIEYDITVNNND